MLGSPDVSVFSTRNATCGATTGTSRTATKKPQTSKNEDTHVFLKTYHLESESGFFRYNTLLAIIGHWATESTALEAVPDGAFNDPDMEKRAD
jgi:hypothetical protein